MFIALYKMTVKKGFENQFEKSWSVLTDCIYRRCGSLGSRLHSAEEKGVYIAYAQWPSADQFFADNNEEISEIESLARKSMQKATVKIELMHKLNVLDDRLKMDIHRS